MFSGLKKKDREIYDKYCVFGTEKTAVYLK